ncbi:MAG: LOG family protein [Anaerolineales bacterium]|nr:LOG family protein [Anaerolineales bacterium]
MADSKAAGPAVKKPVVAVFGAALLPEDGPTYAAARELGAQIAGRGWTAASGGYGGTMAAVSRGAAEAGGRTVGVTSETMTRAGRRTNPWIKEEIRCPTARERLLTLCRLGDAAVALDGGIGTLSEIAFCATQIQTGELSPRPILLLGPLWKATFPFFFRSAAAYLTENDKALFRFPDSPAEAVRILQNVFLQSKPA